MWNAPNPFEPQQTKVKLSAKLWLEKKKTIEQNNSFIFFFLKSNYLFSYFESIRSTKANEKQKNEFNLQTYFDGTILLKLKNEMLLELQTDSVERMHFFTLWERCGWKKRKRKRCDCV